MGLNQSLTEPEEGETPALFVDGLCEMWSGERVARLCNRCELKYKTISKYVGSSVATVEFDSKEDREQFYEALNSAKIGNQTLTIRPHVNYDLPMIPFAKHAEIKMYSTISSPSIVDTLYPYLGLNPDERIGIKKERVSRDLFHVWERDFEYIPADKTNLFSNDIKLSVGYEKDGLVQVGFSTGSRSNPIVVPIPQCDVLPHLVSLIAGYVQSMIQQSSFPPFDKTSGTGKWQEILMKVSSNNQILVGIVTFGGLPSSELDAIISVLGNKVQSIHWIKGEKYAYSPTSPSRVIAGVSLITEKIMDKIFQVHPFTRIPYNLTNYGCMIERIKSFIDNQTILVDVCCGTGLLPILLASYAKRSVGIDSSEHNINIAETNAETNDVSNAFFVNGSTETILPDLIGNVSHDERVVCVLDSLHQGKHNSILRTIAQCQSIVLFVYIEHSLVTFQSETLRALGTKMDLREVFVFEDSPFSHSQYVMGVFAFK